MNIPKNAKRPGNPMPAPANAEQRDRQRQLLADAIGRFLARRWLDQKRQAEKKPRRRMIVKAKPEGIIDGNPSGGLAISQQPDMEQPRCNLHGNQADRKPRR